MLELVDSTVKEEKNKSETKCGLQFLYHDNSVIEAVDSFLTTSLPLVSSADLSYSEFFKNYLQANAPCLFTGEITDGWPSRTDFINKNPKNSNSANQNDTTINFAFFKNVFGNVNVPVTNCDDKSVMDYGGGKTEIMAVCEFMDYWERYIIEDYPSSMPCLYLKDWHITKESARYIAYETPKYFQSDWLNEAWDYKKIDDFRFAYLGPKGTWTPFHCDVYGSFSWSANITGTKKWYIYPPGKENMFRAANGQFNFDYEKPGKKGVDFYEVIQEAGQIIFVPSGWHHIVWNLTDVISINHNWMNGANIVYIWIMLTRALVEVKETIKDHSDIPEFEEQCQLILKANHGMDYEMFFDIIALIMMKRKLESSDGLFGPNHVQFDIEAIENVLKNHVLKDADALSILHGKGKWPTILEYSNIL